MPDEFQEAVGSLSERFAAQRDASSAQNSDQKLSLRSERYERVLDESMLSSVLDGVDAVVFGAFDFFSPLEAEFVGRIGEHVSAAHAVLPLAAPDVDDYRSVDTNESSLSGVDRCVNRAWDCYERFEFELTTATPGDSTPGGEVQNALYRATANTPVSADSAGIEWDTYPAPAHERRGTARKIRTLLDETLLAETQDDTETRVAEDTDSGGEPSVAPADIGVVVTDAEGSTQDLFETFTRYGIPVGVDREVALDITELGAAVEHALAIGQGTGRVRNLTGLLTNPLTNPDWPNEPLEALGQIGVAKLDPSTSLRVYREELLAADTPAATERQASLSWVIELCEEVATVPVTETTEALEKMLLGLGIATETEDDWQLQAAVSERTERTVAQEQAALSALREDAATITAIRDDESAGTVADHLERALHTQTIEHRLGHPRGVDLITPTEIIHSEYRVVFDVGLTQAAFPSSSARLAFTRTINDAHPDFESTDVRHRAQYGLGLLPGSIKRVVFSHPHHDADGDETVAAEFLSELQRICDDDSGLRETHSRETRCLTSREDVQREIGAALATGVDATPQASDSGVEATLDTITDAGVFDTAPGDVPKRIQDGVRCATSRRSAKTTRHDGWIRPDTRQSLDEKDGEFSPSRITKYAECGFKYYMSDMLNYGGDPDYAFDPNRSEKGIFVHRVIARFFSLFSPVHKHLSRSILSTTFTGRCIAQCRTNSGQVISLITTRPSQTDS